MNNLVRTFADYYNRPDFRKFQNTLAKDVYETLGTSYSNSDGEVKMVTEMCNTINGKAFEKLKFYTSIKEKYKQLFLSLQFGGIYAIVYIQTLSRHSLA